MTVGKKHKQRVREHAMATGLSYQAALQDLERRARHAEPEGDQLDEPSHAVHGGLVPKTKTKS